MKTMIYGASDDLIEIEGAISDETYYYDRDICRIFVSDGTEATISYDGEWHIEVTKKGILFERKVLCVGDEDAHEGDVAGCTPYSDVIVLLEGVEWVKIGNKVFK